LRPVVAGRPPIKKSLKAGPVCAAPFPLTDNIVARGDQVRRAPEIQIGERSAEISHERLDVVTTAAGSCSEYLSNMSDAAISSTTARLLASEFGKPAGNDRLVIFFPTHLNDP
jgi:hypothetical protein